MAKNTYDAIVVGAGFGGSSCAGLLAKRGLKVLLVEKNARAGGKAMSLSKGGYTYTAWVVIGAPVEGNLYEAVLRELGVEDKAQLVVPGAGGSIYKNSSGEYVPMPPMPPEAVDPNILFDWLEVPEKEREEALQFFTELTLMPPHEIATLHELSFDDWLGRHKVPASLYGFLVSLCCDGMFMVPVDSPDPQAEYYRHRTQISRYSPVLADVPHCLVLSNADLLPPDEEPPRLEAPEAWQRFVVSSVAKGGVDELLEGLWQRVQLEREVGEPESNDGSEDRWSP